MPDPQELAQVHTMVGNVVNALGEVLGDAVGDAIADAFERIEQRRVEDQETLARNFEAALERQDARFRDALQQQGERFAAAMQQQAQNFAAAMQQQAEMQAQSLQALLREALQERSAAPTGERPPSPNPEVVAESQETLRVGFGQVQAALDRNHRELMEAVREELRALAKPALTRFSPPAGPLPTAPHVRPLQAVPSEPSPILLRAPPDQPRRSGVTSTVESRDVPAAGEACAGGRAPPAERAQQASSSHNADKNHHLDELRQTREASP